MSARANRFALAATALIPVALALPATAAAHGVQGRAETPIPIAAFFWVAAVVLVVSFVGLAVGWSRPRLNGIGGRRAPRALEAAALSPVTAWVLRLLVLGGFLVVTAAAAFGSTSLGANIAPLVVFVVWWIGLVPLSVLFGNVWREVNPWSTMARLTRIPERREARPVPAWVGVWPAAGVLLAFGWFELVYPTPAEPRLLAVLIGVYTAATLAGMWRWGHQVWVDHGEAFSVYTRLLALLSPVEVRELSGQRALFLRVPFVAVSRLRPQPGTVALISVLVATVTYDGLAATGFWARRDVAASERLIALGLSDFQAGVLIGTFGLLGSLAVFTIGYELCSRMSGWAANWRYTTVGRVAVAFAHSLIPIAFAYFVAHYFTLFVFQSQDLARLISDPFGRGADLFGTADSRIDFQLVSAETIWTVQVAAIVVGHVLALAFAHDRALELGRTHREAIISQGPVLVLMVGLTVAGLWSLSAGMGA
ncbi:MAG: fenitrothion hydrolase [Thermoleophilia bacterium]